MWVFICHGNQYIMPKQHIYLPQNILDKIKSVVEERLNNGETHSEANISKLCVEMISTGIQVFEYRRDKSNQQEPEADNEKIIIEHLIKTQLCVQKLLEMQFSLTEIKADSRYNFADIKDKIIRLTNRDVTQIFKEK